MREQLEIFIGAAKKRSEAMDHVLLFGPPAWARPRSPHHRQRAGREPAPDLGAGAGKKPKDLAAILTNLERNDVLSSTRSTASARSVEEILYPALEDYQIDIA